MTPDNLALAPADAAAARGNLAGEAELFRMMVENVTDVIVCGDASFRRTYVSPAVRDLLGYEPAELIGGHGLELVHPDDRGRVATTLAELGPSKPRLAFMFRMRRKDGSYVWVGGTYRHLSHSGGILTVLRDITKYKEVETALAEANERLADANLALQALVNRDGLTGLANRRCFDERLADEFSRAARQEQSLSLVLLDADAFKMFNDHYGHLAGDECLRRIATTAAGVLRRPGDLAARYGGEEIAVLLPATDASGATLVAEEIRASVASLGIAHLGSAHGIVTVSAGVGSARPVAEGAKPPDLIAAADRALYAAKLAGRNRVCAAPSG